MLAPTTTVLLVVYIPPSLRAEAHRIEPMLVVTTDRVVVAVGPAGLLKSPFEWLTLNRRRLVGLLRRKDPNAARLSGSCLSMCQCRYCNPTDGRTGAFYGTTGIAPAMAMRVSVALQSF